MADQTHRTVLHRVGRGGGVPRKRHPRRGDGSSVSAALQHMTPPGDELDIAESLRLLLHGETRSSRSCRRSLVLRWDGEQKNRRLSAPDPEKLSRAAGRLLRELKV